MRWTHTLELLSWILATTQSKLAWSYYEVAQLTMAPMAEVYPCHKMSLLKRTSLQELEVHSKGHGARSRHILANSTHPLHHL